MSNTSSDSGDSGMLRPFAAADFNALLAVINGAAAAYRGVIPADCWHEPYMPAHELAAEIAAGVRFVCYERNGSVIGVMGSQEVQDVTLIRHAYVSTRTQRSGIGAALLQHLRTQTARPVLIGTWAAANWAIRFYEKHGFRVIGGAEKNTLLKQYWTIPERQVETSVVLADERWPKHSTR